MILRVGAADDTSAVNSIPHRYKHNLGDATIIQVQSVQADTGLTHVYLALRRAAGSLGGADLRLLLLYLSFREIHCPALLLLEGCCLRTAITG